MAVMLDATGDLVLTGHDIFGTLTVDRSGALGLEYQELRNIFTRLAKALNQQHEQVQRLQGDVDRTYGQAHALEGQTEGLNSRLSETEDTMREVKIQLESTRALAEAAGAQASTEVPTKDDLREVLERCDALSKLLDTQDLHRHEDAQRLQDQIAECDRKLEKTDQTIRDDLESRFIECDDTLLAHKMELDVLQASTNEINKRKVNKSEMTDMQKIIDLVREEQKRESTTLQEAQQNLQKLNDCVNLVNENKTQTQNLWRIFREETQEVRDWVSKGLTDLRTMLRTKMDEASALAHIDELRQQVREDRSYLMEATSRVQEGIRRKAEAGDLERLQDTIEEVMHHTAQPKQLLVGTKCLSCDREATEEVTVEGALDVVKERQQQDLFQGVQRMLNRKLTGGSGQDVLTYVAVHVGSPRRAYSPGGGGPYEVRDATEHYSSLMPVNRQSARGPPPVQATGTPRSPPRESVPLVRVNPRRPAPRSPPGQPVADPPAYGYQSMQKVLGPSVPKRPKNTSLPPVKDRAPEQGREAGEVQQALT